jgi:mycothiol synthase
MRASCPDDAEAAAEVIAATQLADTGRSDVTAEEVLSDWQSIDIAQDAIVVTGPGDRIVASADIVNHGYVHVTVYGYVHPEFRGRGIGRVLVDWGESLARDRMERAPAGARIVVQQFVHSSNQTARQLLEACGYTPVRATYTMEIDLTAPPPAPEWPSGVTVRSFVPGQDERATYEAHEEAFRDLWGRPRNTFEQFLVRTEVDAFDPDLWFLVEDGGGIAGICLCKVFGGQAIVETVGVRRRSRNRGIGLAMLHHAFGAFYQRGVYNIWLSVDAESLTGAPRLYERAGMHVTNTYILHQKELRPGVDMGQRALDD